MGNTHRSISAKTIIASIVCGLLLTGVAGIGGATAIADPVEPAPPATEPEGPPVGAPPAAPTAEGADDVDIDLAPTTAAPTGPVPAPAALTPGQSVVHEYDVVVARVYDDPGLFPPGPVAEQISHATIDTLLSDSAKWWSDQTGLDFDFNQNTHYATINTTCDTLVSDSFAAMGHPYDTSIYTSAKRDLLILAAGERSCIAPAVGLALTVAKPGDLTAGGVYEVVIGPWDGTDTTADVPAIVTTTVHEFGHTVGLGHANSLTCKGVTLGGDDRVGPLWDGYATDWCDSLEYGDRSSVMGRSRIPDYPAGYRFLNSLQRDYLGVGWDDVARVDAAVASQEFTIARYDLASAGQPSGVVVSSPDGSFLGSLEYRPKDDARFYGASGVYLTLGDVSISLKTDAAEPLGLEPTFREGSAVRVPLPVGTTYISASGSVRLTVVSVTDTTARVSVTVTGQPGLPGAVTVAKSSGALTAHVEGATGVPPVTVTYQWFRNGAAISGATAATYTPALPDPNAVYRVEATFTSSGHAATTRSSRGIVPDDQRLGSIGSGLSLRLLDQNGEPVDCAGMPLQLTYADAGGTVFAEHLIGALSATGETGVCTGDAYLPLNGNYTITAGNPTDVNLSSTWQSAYWEPVAVPVTLGPPSAGARAGLLVALLPPVRTLDGASLNTYQAFTVPSLMAGTGNQPLSVTVSVTDDTGAPAVGVTVALTSDTPGVVLTPANPVTDEYGLARATADWDLTRPLPATPETVQVTATVPGVALVQGSPASMLVSRASSERIVTWFDTDAAAAADGTDAVKLRIRAWDETGNPITDQAGRLHPDKWVTSAGGRYTDVTLGDPVWDAADQSYVMNITSTSPQTILIQIWLDDYAALQLPAPIEFWATPLTELTGFGTSFAASDGTCDGTDAPAGRVQVLPVATPGRLLETVEGGVVFSLPAGSPLRFTTDPVVKRPDKATAGGWYTVGVTSSVAGTFPVRVVSADGSVSATINITANDAAIDPAHSTVSLDAGPRQADGSDAYTLTADLVTVCHVPVTNLATDLTYLKNNDYWVRVDATPSGSTTPATAVHVGTLTADPAHPGRFTAPVTSTAGGTYWLTLNQMRYQKDPAPGDWVATPVNATPLTAEFVSSGPSAKLELSRDGFGVFKDPCGGPLSITPDSITATVTVTDATGAPMGGVPVGWEADDPLIVGPSTHVTGPDGKASVTIELNGDTWRSGMYELPLTVKAGGAEASTVVRVTEAIPMLPNPIYFWKVSAAPTVPGTVAADGVASWTVTVLAVDQCDVAMPDMEVSFTTTGTAHLSGSLMKTDSAGLARITVTDTVAETVQVSAYLGSGGTTAIPGSPVSLTFTDRAARVSLTLDQKWFGVSRDPCGGPLSISPESLLATVTVTDSTGAPMAGEPVEWEAADPLIVGPSTRMTGPDGKASVTIKLNGDTWRSGMVALPLKVRAAGAEAETTVEVAEAVVDPNPVGLWTITAAPTVPGAVRADGVASWTVTVTALDQCKVPLPDQEISFLATGSPLLSHAWVRTDSAGVARITVTDTTAETVQVSAYAGHVTVPPAFGKVPGSPVSLEFVNTVAHVSLGLDRTWFGVFRDPCGGPLSINPESLLATVTVTDEAGHPMAGVPVDWEADDPLIIGPSTRMTGPDGKASVTIKLNGDTWRSGMQHLPLKVRAAGGEAETIVDVAEAVTDVNPVGFWTITAAPTVPGDVPADGVATWTVTVVAVDQCKVPLPNIDIAFTGTGSGKVSATPVRTDSEGRARITVTDTVAETVKVSAFATGTGSSMGAMVPGSPVSLVFVRAKSVGPSDPVVQPSNGTSLRGTSDVGTTITARDRAGKAIPGCTDVPVDSKGKFTCRPAKRLADNSSVTVVAKDAAGRVSNPVLVIIHGLQIKIDYPTRHRSERQVVTGYHFNPGERVHLVVRSNPWDGGYAVADENGTVVFPFAVAPALALGDHTATLTGDDSGELSAKFAVVDTPEADTGGIVGSGAPGSTTGLLSGLALLLGTAFLRLRRA